MHWETLCRRLTDAPEPGRMPWMQPWGHLPGIAAIGMPRNAVEAPRSDPHAIVKAAGLASQPSVPPAGAATACRSATGGGGAWSPACRIARAAPSRQASPPTPRSPSSLVIAAPAAARPGRGRCPGRQNSPIAGTWRPPAFGTSRCAAWTVHPSTPPRWSAPA